MILLLELHIYFLFVQVIIIHYFYSNYFITHYLVYLNFSLIDHFVKLTFHSFIMKHHLIFLNYFTVYYQSFNPYHMFFVYFIIHFKKHYLNYFTILFLITFCCYTIFFKNFNLPFKIYGFKNDYNLMNKFKIPNTEILIFISEIL